MEKALIFPRLWRLLGMSPKSKAFKNLPAGFYATSYQTAYLCSSDVTNGLVVGLLYPNVAVSERIC